MSQAINIVETFKDGNLATTPTSLRNLLVGFDSEHTRNDNKKYTNTCLSYQIAGLNLADGSFKKDIYYPDYNFEVRLKFYEVIEWIFGIFGIYDEEIDNYNLILVCHFAIAEWAMIRDRKEIAHYFEFLYKTLVTFKKKMFTFITKNGKEVTITFELSDTILLLPPTHRSLEKATKLLLSKEFHKKDLTIDEKSNMLHLLKTEPIKFENYAIHDAEITLRLYIKLQYILNIINGTTSKKYVTIGSATVNHYVNFSKDMFSKEKHNSQYNPNNSIYQQYLPLAKRAYLGGINNSYYIGEAKDMVFLDIDFSSAYPTVMNLLQFGNFGDPIKASEPVETNFGND